MSPAVLLTSSVIPSRKSHKGICHTDSKLHSLAPHRDQSTPFSTSSDIVSTNAFISHDTSPNQSLSITIKPPTESPSTWNVFRRLVYFHHLGAVNLIYLVTAYLPLDSRDLDGANMQDHGGSRGLRPLSPSIRYCVDSARLGKRVLGN
ncbi:uncharacterized protein ARMOST_20196 [Armillaria ostoyae]|uniref:Uncharacterized protein n=1 Tax=Armillaria ostoyae TaxID=47428 RepID=A0A284S6M8_ARMOS|nr:uncharacterized protein ARMOST_20196 [Armillaria ostoyae]